MSGTSLVRILRSVHPMGLALSVCGILVAFCAAVFFGFWAYMSAGPGMAAMEKDLQAVQAGTMKPNHSGLVSVAKNTMYVTRAADKTITVLWPYNFAHDDNYFEGCLFSDHILTSDKTIALAPTRYPTAYKP